MWNAPVAGASVPPSSERYNVNFLTIGWYATVAAYNECPGFVVKINFENIRNDFRERYVLKRSTILYRDRSFVCPFAARMNCKKTLDTKGLFAESTLWAI